MLLLLLLSSVIYLAHAASIKVPSPNGRENDAKTPWDLIEAIYGTSGIRSFNGTWITGEWVVTSRYQCTQHACKHVVNIHIICNATVKSRCQRIPDGELSYQYALRTE